MDNPPWRLLEERRAYAGPTRETVAAAFARGLEEALGEGYQPGSLDWQSDQLLIVTYEYDPTQAPRPIQPVRRRQ